MKKLIFFILIASCMITACAGQKDSTSSRKEKKSKQKVLPYRISIESNLLADSIRAYIEPQLREKGYKVLDANEHKKLSEDHYNTQIRRLDLKKAKSKDIIDALNSGEEYIRILLIRCNIHQGSSDQLEFKDLTYKIFILASTKIPAFTTFDLSSVANPSLKTVCNELARILIEAYEK